MKVSRLRVGFVYNYLTLNLGWLHIQIGSIVQLNLTVYTVFFLYLEGLKRGICPIPLPVDSCEGETDDECTLDSDCFGDKKCCSDSCQKLCVQPPQSKCDIFSR